MAEKGAMPIAGGTDVLVQARMLSGEVPGQHRRTGGAERDF
jgi:hypothetical protein